jgi:isopentenyl-diphosphate Delta-isomerase
LNSSQKEKRVILVNDSDEAVGVMEKTLAHKTGSLHRAYSIFILNDRNEMLLQQRAMEKYHSGGLWSNACCSHPAPGEDLLVSASTRLKEELGISTTLKWIFNFTYQASLDNGLVEHEFDHVLAGNYNGPAIPDPGEVMNHAFFPLTQIQNDLQDNPSRFTAWFHIAFPLFLQYIRSHSIKK